MLPDGPAKDELAALAGLATWNEGDVLHRLESIAAELDQSTADGWTVDDLVVSIARDYAQRMPVTTDSAKLSSDAEHSLLDGRIGDAVAKLTAASGYAFADGSVGGTVPATLSLTLGAPASFGAFTPGVAHDYLASTTATVTSTAGDATLSVSDPSTTAPGHLVNGAFALPQPLQAHIAPGAFGTVGDTPLTLLSYAGPVSDDPETIELEQPIAATDALRTGSYTKTLTFTLSTTNP
jgi:hypothetical protein